MRPTSSRPTWPVRTIRTTSMASGVVTRRPPLNSDSMPSRPSIELICGPPPWTTTGWMPTWWRNTMSSAKARRRSSLTMALPPYLITMMVPANRWIHGRASTKVAALSWASDMLVVSRVWVFMLSLSATVFPGARLLAGVGAVLVHVVVGKVVRPDGGLGVAGLQVDLHQHFARLQVHEGPVVADAA